MRLTIEEISEATHAQSMAGAPAQGVIVSGVTWDSRVVKPGNLYVALPGERVDGHDFAEAAVTAGAAGVLAARPLEVSVPVVVVDDVQEAFTRLASYWRAKLGGTVVGLTGSTGKTTTKNLVRDVLARAGSVLATLANQNNELGVPNTLLAAEADTRSVVVEMGMRGLGQIAELAEVAKPEWGLITNVGESHIELLGSRENIAHAKAELFCALPPDGIAFVNAADDYADELCSFAKLEEREVSIVRFDGTGSRPEGDDPSVWASDIALDGQGCPSFTMHAAGFGRIGRPEADGECACALALRGLHNVSNACSAAAVGLAAGLDIATCCAALAASEPEQGRQQVYAGATGITVVDDSYNANPDSMGASLRTFAAMDAKGRRVAVLGDMLELGDFARAGHERMGVLAAQLGIDELVCVGELSRSIAEAAIAGGMPANAVRVCDDAASALEIVRELVASGDAVLVKASHSIGLEKVVEGLVG